MSKKISDFITKTTLTNDSFIPIIDKEGGGFENFKIKINEYFCTKVQYQDLLKTVNNLSNSIAQNNTSINNNFINLNQDINKIIQQNINNLNSDLLSEINKKQNKDIGVSDRVIITNQEGIITASDITKTQLYYLNGLTGNIQDQIDKNIKNIQGQITSIDTLVKKLEVKIELPTPDFGNPLISSTLDVYNINNKFKAPTDCFFFHQVCYDEGSFGVFINDSFAFKSLSAYGDGYNEYPILIPLKKGTTLFFSAIGTWDAASPSQPPAAHTLPFKILAST